ncbi:phage terminase small subunit P27 family [Enterobacter hormaechei]
MKVTIDGVSYAPVCDTGARIGIAITTHNRADALKRALAQHQQFLPQGALVVVIDDGSKPPAEVFEDVQLLRHETSLGIVASKNASLSALMDAGCEHLFIWDDDAWPIADNWYLPYIESPEPHLAYQFLDLAGTNKLKDMEVLYRDDKHIAYTGQRGVMLYYHRSAIEKVGGFDPVYGRGMYEHSDLALRIHNAGLTTWAYGDVVGSEKLIHSLDEHEAVERSVPRPDRQALVERNVKIHNERRDAGFTGYRHHCDTLEVEGYTYRTETQSGDVLIKAHPAAIMKADAWKRLRAMLGEFGMTPASRSKVNAKGPDAVDPLAEFMKARD